MNIELEKKRLQFQGQNELYEIQMQIKKEGEKQKLNNVKFDTQQMELDNKLLY